MIRTRLMQRRLTRERVLVTLTDGDAFDGVLLEADDRHLVLADAAQLIGDTGDRVSIDGRLYLPVERVAYLQHPGA